MSSNKFKIVPLRVKFEEKDDDICDKFSNVDEIVIYAYYSNN